MPKVGIEPLRKQQLIDATLKSIEQFRLLATTIITISCIAGMSSGIIRHYFHRRNCYRQSGLERENDSETLRHYTQLKAVYVGVIALESPF